MPFPAEKCGFGGAHGRKPQEIAGGLQDSRIKNASQLSLNTHPNKKSLRKQFSELFVQTVLPLPFKLNKRHAERVWANCLCELFSVGFIGVGGFLGWAFLP